MLEVSEDCLATDGDSADDDLQFGLNRGVNSKAPVSRILVSQKHNYIFGYKYVQTTLFQPCFDDSACKRH